MSKEVEPRADRWRTLLCSRLTVFRTTINSEMVATHYPEDNVDNHCFALSACCVCVHALLSVLHRFSFVL